MSESNLLLSTIEKQNLWSESLLIERNDFLNTPGQSDTKIYFVESGSLRIFITDKDEEHVIRFGYQNNILAALDSFITGEPTNYYIQAIKKTKIKSINKETISKLIESSVELQNAWVDILQSLILQQLEREQDILTSSPKERYHRVLSRSPQLFQEIPDKHIASYLRMSPETLSRIKKS